MAERRTRDLVCVAGPADAGFDDGNVRLLFPEPEEGEGQVPHKLPAGGPFRFHLPDGGEGLFHQPGEGTARIFPPFICILSLKSTM